MAADHQHADDIFPRRSGATNRARKPARRVISFIGRGGFLLQVGDLDRLALREGLRDVRLVEADVLTSQRVNQLLIHAVGGAQMKFALQLIEDVDRAGLGARELHRFGDDGGEHGFEIERRVHRLGHFAERAQLVDRAAKFIGALAQFVEQSRVLDGKDRLGGETVNELDLFLAERLDLGAVDRNCADWFALFEHGNGRIRANSELIDDGCGERIAVAIHLVIPVVLDVKDLFCLYGAHQHRPSARLRRHCRIYDTAEARCTPHLSVFIDPQGGVLGAADASGILQNGIENRLKIAGRA